MLAHYYECDIPNKHNGATHSPERGSSCCRILGWLDLTGPKRIEKKIVLLNFSITLNSPGVERNWDAIGSLLVTLVLIRPLGLLTCVAMKCLNIALFIGVISVVVVAVVVDQMQLAWSKNYCWDKSAKNQWSKLLRSKFLFSIYLDQFMADLSFENQFEDTEFNSNSSIENAGKDNY